MYVTKFIRKKVRGKMQYVCTESREYFGCRDVFENLTFHIFTYYKIIYAFTENQVNLGSCKRPHHYIKFGFCN
jgi:hypothetical protein